MLRASGLSARNFARRDLVAQLARSQKKDGSWEGLVDHTAFAVFGLRAYGYSASSVRSAVLWIERQQNRDGGFGFGPAGGSSDVDDTGSVLQALAAGGRKNSKAARGAISYLRHAQNPDGGFGQSKGASSNAQSTAWAVQGLVGRGPQARGAGSQRPQPDLLHRVTRDRERERALLAHQHADPGVGHRRGPGGVRSQVAAARAREAEVARARGGCRSGAHEEEARREEEGGAGRDKRLHGGPMATIAQTTPAPTPAPVTPAARVANPVKARTEDQGNGALVWALVGIGVAALLAGAYLARRWMRRQGPSPA